MAVPQQLPPSGPVVRDIRLEVRLSEPEKAVLDRLCVRRGMQGATLLRNLLLTEAAKEGIVVPGTLEAAAAA